MRQLLAEWRSAPAMHSEAEALLSQKCPVMRRLIKAHGPCQLVPHKRTPYEALVSAVAHQQLHANAAEAILRPCLKTLKSHI